MQVPLYHVDFWVQIHDLLAGLMFKGMAKQFGGFLGKFLDYDAKSISWDLSVEALPKRAIAAKSCWLHDEGDAPWAVEMGSFLVRVI
ncbi:hypothetical protein Gotri_010932 [Gossypium trilobum]|uniref:DUF4283 domain-containing protein n=1 Tax=Gossypium trilobum TaxID=34281 RepID=A0A7J9ES28_9ROSI|nr:hypothetical protein [Gossypium trilobum]